MDGLTIVILRKVSMFEGSHDKPAYTPGVHETWQPDFWSTEKQLHGDEYREQSYRVLSFSKMDCSLSPVSWRLVQYPEEGSLTLSDGAWPGRTMHFSPLYNSDQLLLHANFLFDGGTHILVRLSYLPWYTNQASKAFTWWRTLRGNTNLRAFFFYLSWIVFFYCYFFLCFFFSLMVMFRQ